MARADPPVAQECVEGYLFAGRPPQLLVLRRPPGRGSIWVPVSGKVEPADPNLAAAVHREVLEETGFSEFLRVFSLDWHVRFDGPDGRAWRLHAYAFELTAPAPPRLNAEHEAFEWVGFEEALRRLHYADNRQAVTRLAAQLTPAPDGPSAPTV